MGAIAGLTGLGGGASGTGFSGPQYAQIQAPTNPDQVGAAYAGNQAGLTSQQQLLAALQNQNGVGNQSQVYGQLQGIASGAVNPAQAQFAQNTAQNVGNQAALMAGQRGASSNVGLIARQAAQQGAGIQQQAVGQEATQQANNQINAIGQAGQLATTQAGQQIGQTNANVQAQQAEQQNLLNALQGFNTNTVASQGNVNTANAGLASTTMQGQQAVVGGAANAGAALAAAAGGGEIVKMAAGGDTSTTAAATPGVYSGTNGPVSSFGQFLKGATSGPASNQNNSSAPQTGAQTLQNGTSNLIQALASSSPSGQNVTMPDGSVAGPSNNYGAAPLSSPDMGSSFNATPAAPSLGSDLTYAKGGMTKDFRTGGKVNATDKKEKAVKSGNSYSNDKIPAVLSEHEIVLPRSVTLSQDPVGNAAKFVAGVIAKRRSGK